MSARRRQAKPLRRSTGKRPERRTLVVFTEGKNSEPDYINGLKKLSHVAENVALSIEVDALHGVPLTLVEQAIVRSKDDEIDECWCVFDVEWPKHHPNLQKAVGRARQHKIGLAVSNPCFELWLILHHRKFSKFENTDKVESLSRALDKRSGKTIDASLYMPLRRVASEHAAMLEKQHARNGTELPHDNPSSGMHHLLKAIEGEGPNC